MGFFADLHIHTKYSFDSLSEPEEVLNSAVRKELSAVAITDHNGIEGALAAQSIARRKNLSLQVIIGEEVSTDKGDLLAYFLKEKIAPGKLEQALAKVAAQGAVCCAAHPFDFARHGMELRALGQETLARIDAIETFNARVALASQNRDAALFAAERGKPAFAGSDAHHPSEVGTACTQFFRVTGLDARNILSARRECVGKTSSPLVRFHSRYAVAVRRFGRLLPKRLK
ncbi:MAG: PHP domain-containing protein [Candidatus Micrarchaeota archaeon]|nr:PHP domain-containing protein [Candidatus Micrarchaeota archaeon]